MDARDQARRASNRRDDQDPRIGRAGPNARGRRGAIVFRTSDTVSAYPATPQAYYPADVVELSGVQAPGNVPAADPLASSTAEVVANVGGAVIPRAKLGVAVQIDGVFVTQWG